MPWEGYNFEDAILISERLVYDDIYTSLHIERFSIAICETKFGLEEITTALPNTREDKLRGLKRTEQQFKEFKKLLKQVTKLDKNGIGIIGSWFKEKEVLVGKITPQAKPPVSPYQKLLYDILEVGPPTERDTSLRVPERMEGKVINAEILETKNITPGKTYNGPGCVHLFLLKN